MRKTTKRLVLNPDTVRRIDPDLHLVQGGFPRTGTDGNLNCPSEAGSCPAGGCITYSIFRNCNTM